MNLYSSAEERKQRAEALKDARNQRYAYNDYIKAVEAQNLEIRKAQTIAELKQRQEQQERENANFFVRAFSTIGDIVANVFTGALKGLEGIYDLGAGLVGAVGGIFSQDFQQSVQKHIAYDIVGENIGNPLQDLTKYSYTNDGWFGQAIEDVAGGVGQMLPAVAVNLIPGAGQAASLAMIGGMSSGNATEEAFQQEGTNYYRGLAYGVTSGVVEGATEKMFGGFNSTKALTGAGYLDKLTKNIGQTATTRIIRQFAEEGIEEVAAEFVNPLLQNIYKDKGFFEDFLTTEHLKDMAYAGTIGGLTSFVFGETVGRVHRRANNIQENLENLDALNRKEENLWSKNDNSQNERITELRNKIYSNISKELTTAKPQLRQRLLNQLDNYGLTDVFTESGEIKAETSTENKDKNIPEYMPRKSEYESIDYSAEPVNYNIEAYSPILRGKEKLLEYAPTSKSLTSAQIEAKKLFHTFNKGKERLNLVFTDANLGKDYQGKKLDSLYSNGIIYVNTKANANNALIKYELTKSLENTKQYNKYAEFIFKELADNQALKQRYGDIQELYDETVNKYTAKIVADAVKKGQKELSDIAIGRIQELARVSTVKSVVSRYTNEVLFTNPQQVQKLANTEPALVLKLISWIHSTKRKLSKTNDMTNVMTFLDNAETLYKNALINIYSGIDNADIKNYNKNKGDIDYGRERRNLSSYEGEKWSKSKDTSEQTGRLQEESRESGQGKTGSVQEETSRRFGFKELVAKNVKVKAVKSKLDFTKSELDIYNQNKAQGLETVFYDGSATPLNQNIVEEDAGYDGFVDIGNKTVYLRSDKTVSATTLAENNRHENLHFFISQAPEAYTKLKETIFKQLTPKSKSIIEDRYGEAYFEVYNGNIERVYEEIVVDLSIGREQGQFVNVDIVNDAIKEFYASYSDIAKTETIKPYKKIKNTDTKYTVAHDSEGNPLSPKQADYFKDSKVRDENGNLLVVYHGTNNREETSVWNSKYNWYDTEYEKFTIFKPNEDTTGFFFANDYNNAGGYGSTVYEVYLNIKNPLIIDCNNANYAAITHKGITQDTYEWAAWAKKNGYDGVVFNNIRDGVDYGAMQKSVNEYVVFNSNQIKETTNLNPTINDDIRYVINKNKDIKDLVVVHNTTATKLLKSINLGGLVVPSVAITKTDNNFDNFGEISLIFRTDTIDPQDKRNKVYASDIYSRRFPKTINKFAKNADEKLAKRFEESAKILDIKIKNLDLYLEEGNISTIADGLKNKEYVRLQYLLDNGVDFEPIYKEFTLNEMDKKICDMLISKFPAEVKDSSLRESDFLIDKVVPEIKRVKKEHLLSKGFKGLANSAAENTGLYDADNYLEKAEEYLGKKGQKVLDETATNSKIRELVKGEEQKVYSYVSNILEQYNEGEYYRTNLDYYDKKGFPRSFNQLYKEVNLQNILDYMTQGDMRDSEGFDYGVGNLRSLLSKQYNSIEEIKKNKDKIVSAEKIAGLQEISRELHYNLSTSIDEDAGNDILKEIAKTNRSDASIIKIFKENYLDAPSHQLIRNIQDFLNNLEDYPTGYFEAKPQRVVSFDEVVKVFAPRNVDKEIIQFFKDKKINIQLYDESMNRAELLKTIPDDIRFALSRGQIKKEIAKASKGKVYKKQDAEKAINNILSLLDINENYIATIPNASKEEAINKLWIHLNSTAEGYRGNAAEDIADYLIEHSLVESLYEESDANAEAVILLDALKSYLRKLDLTPIKSEIYNKFDKNTNVFAVWGKRKGETGLGVDEVAQELEEMGIMQFESQNPADQFFEIVDAYNSAKDLLKKERKTLLNEFVSNDELKIIKNAMKQEVLLSYDKYGDKTKYLQMTEKYQKKIGFLIERLKDVKIRNKVVNNLFATIDRIKGLEKYKSASIELPPEVSAFVKELGKIKTWAGNLSNNVREIMRMYSREVNGQKLYELLANSEGVFNPTAQLIEDIAHQQGDLSTTELQNLDLILKNFIHNVRNYDKIFFENRNQSETAVATQAIYETEKATPYKNTGFLGLISKFSRTMISPVWRFERLSNYQQDGIMTKMFKEFQKGVDKQALFEYETSRHFEAFLKEHKKTINTWRNQEIEIAGHKMSKGQMISLYMLSLRKQAQSHLFSSVDGDSGVIRLANEKASARGETVIAIREKGEDVSINRATIKEIESKLSSVDMDFIKLVQHFFDKIARDAKEETDMALFGVSNVGEENYIPIRVAEDQIYKQMGNEVSNFSDLFNVYTPSFNKDVKPNAKNKIVVENILDIVNRHTKQMGAYYGLALPMRTFNRVYNKKLESGQTLRKEINKVDSKFEEYVGTLLTDMQGGGRQRSGVDKTSDKVIGTIRSWGARAALGMNLKVLANQFVSLSASASVGIKYKNIMKGFGMAIANKTDFDMLVKYAPMLFLRFRDGNNIDVGLLKDDISKAGQFDRFMGKLAMTPISKIDKFVVGAVWNSALEQTKSHKYEDYSEEHYKKAAELTEKAVIKSQANYIPLYRPEILRSKNSVIQLATMFMSEPLQSFSLLVSSADKMRVAKRMLDKANSPAERDKAMALLKKAKTEWARATGVVFIDTIILTLIAQLFRWLKELGNEEEEEDKVVSILTDFAGNYIGMIPFARDIVNVTQGFRNSDMYDSAISNLGQSLVNLTNVISMLASGQAYDENEIKEKTHNAIVSMSQTFGIPLRNLENYTKGIIDKFSPSTAYKLDKFFYDGTTASYLSELNYALKKGDDALADTILDAFLTEEKIPVKEKALRDTFKELYSAGYNVFPKCIGNSIEVNGEELVLSKSQQTKLKSFYAQSNEVIKSMVSTEVYQNASDSAKAKSIKGIYDYYYNLTLEEFTGESVVSEKDRLFFKALPIDKIMIIIKTAKELESDKDENGKTLAGSKKRKVQEYISKLPLKAAEKYMIMGYLGYKNVLGEKQVKYYIQKLRLTKAEKEALFVYCGY